MNKNKTTSPRLVALELLRAVEFNEAYANLELPKLLAKSRMDHRDNALAQELAFGTIRWQLFYDLVIEKCANRLTSEIDIDSLLVLRLGVHQLLSMRVPAHAALDQTVELAKFQVSRGAAGFVNGVLRRVTEKSRNLWAELLIQGAADRFEQLSIQYSHPLWIVKALYQALELDDRTNDIEKLLAADNVSPLVQLAALPGINAFDESRLMKGPSSPIGFTLPDGDPKKIHGFNSGFLRVQDQGSQLAALALTNASSIDAGEVWLDMCAGPGGKAALLAAVAKPLKVKLLCNELLEHRSILVRQALAPVDTSVEVIENDGRDIAKIYPQYFDRILLDAPCSGLGALRRRPESRWRKSIKDISHLSVLQEQLLDSAWRALKPGGTLAYVTCSPHIAETNAIVDWALRTLEGCRLLDTHAILKSLNPDLVLNPKRKTVQLWPHVNNTDAMFIAILVKGQQMNRVNL